MKKIKVQILCTIVLLVNMAPLHCMFRRVTQWRPATGGMSREAAARLVAAQKAERLSLEQSVVQRTSDISTWSGWFQSKADQFKSLFQRSPVQSKDFQQTSYAATRTAPFGARGFSTTVPQRASFWDKVASFVTQKLPEERFAEEFNEIVLSRRNSFTVENLEKAKQFIDKNENFINTLIKSHYYVGKGQTGPRDIHVIRDDQLRFIENALSIVMRHLFPYISNDLAQGNPNHYSQNLDTIKNYLELAKYIANKGGKLMGQEVYQDVYFTKLMPAYRRLHSVYPPDPRIWPFHPEAGYLKDMREIFTELDPLFEKLMPEFEATIRGAQKNRAKIDSDPQGYRQALQDEEDKRYPEKKAVREKASREEYLSKKRKRKEILWRYANNRHDIYDDYLIPKTIKQAWANVEFIEEEYKEWLKDPGGFINFHYGPSYSYQSRTDAEHAKQQQQESRQKEALRYKGKAIWDLLPGVTSTSSKEEIGKAFRTFMLENHPDRQSKDMNDEKRKEINEQVNEVTAAWDDYTSPSKQQRATK